MPENTIITASGRSLEEIAFSVKLNMKDMVGKAIEIGLDLMEAKEACRHGEWLPWLESTGIGKSTAANYMRVAREVGSNSPMAKLPYSKVLALLALPEEERESVAEVAESMSAAEIRKLTEERNRAAEAANAESARADRAEAEAKDYFDRIGSLNVRIQNLKAEAEKAYQRGKDDTVNFHRELQEKIELLTVEKRELQEKAEKLKADLLVAENNRVEVEIEKAPADYEEIKVRLQTAQQNAKMLIDAAASAEERAAALEEQLERAKAGTPEKVPADIILGKAMNDFFRECELMPYSPENLRGGRDGVEACVGMIENWCRNMREALEKTSVEAEAVIA
ncbi:MAG: DUF3102 domain-containing protein [Clostridia bacterium]|nr:DUF3102 domain-containing protein [Clostridia bacterium]